MGQDVGSLRQSNTDLPRNAGDQFVLNHFFGAISAVQDSCPGPLKASLKEQNALAACATFSADGGMADILRTAVEAHFMSATIGDDASWATPWTANADFGTVRQLIYKGVTYYLTLDAGKGEARVILFR